jgi:dihydrofolate reductase
MSIKLYNLIVAICSNRGIGLNGKLPWTIKEDMHYFSKLTKGAGNNAIIMGSKTWKNLPNKSLPKRDNLVLSTSTDNLDYDLDEGHVCKFFKSIAEIDIYCNKMNYDNVWVIGGASIYNQFLKLKKIGRCYVTMIQDDYICDTFFQPLPESDWILEKNQLFLSLESDIELLFLEYKQRIN